MWSFGVTAWELLSGGNLPYAFIGREDEVAERVCAGVRLARPDGCTDELWCIVNSCWAAEPGQRPRFAQLGVSLSAQLHPIVAIVAVEVPVEVPVEVRGGCWRLGGKVLLDSMACLGA